jgi:hypothetical protein
MHSYRIFDGRAFPAEDGVAGRSGNGDYIDIERGCEPTIQPEFFATIEVPSVQAAEVQEAQVNGLLDLVGVGPGEKDVGDMGFQYLDAVHVGSVYSRIQQR